MNPASPMKETLRCGKRSPSDIESEIDDVAVAHHVVLAFQAQRGRLAAGRHRARAHEVVEGDHLRADEAALDVGMDLAPRPLRARAAPEGPGPALLLPPGGDT